MPHKNYSDSFNTYAVSKLPTFSDDFSVDNWTDVGTDYFVGSGRNNFTIKRPNLQDNYDFRDIGFVLSDTKWVMRFKIVFTSNTKSTGAGTYLWFVLSDSTAGQQVAQDSIGMGFVTSSTQDDVFLAKSDGTGLDETTGFPSPAPITEFVGLVTRYVEVKRLSSTSAKIEIFSDSAFTVSLGSQTRTVSAGTTGLRYLKMSSWNIFASTYNGTQIGYIDDVEIWNGVDKGTTFFQDDFSGLDNWVDAGTGVGVNTATDVLDWDTSDSNANNSTVNDLTTVDNSNWLLRFKLTINNLVQGTDLTASIFYLGVSSISQASGSSTAQDFIGFRLLNNLNNLEWNIFNTNNQGLGVAGADATFTTVPAVGTIWVVIRRTSPDSYDVSFYSDSNYLNLIQRRTGITTNGTNTLRYIKFTNDNTGDGTENGVQNGTIDDVEFYDRTIVANNILKPVPELNFDFSSATGWVQTGTGVSINTTLRQIDGWSTDGAIDKRVTFDMGINGIVSESDWTVEFEYEWSASNLPAHAPLVISNNNQHFDLFAPILSDDVIGVVHGITSNQLTIYSKNDLVATNVSTGIAVLANVRYYVRLERIRDTTVKLSVFSDPDFTNHATGSPIFQTVSSSIDSLRYIMSANLYSGGLGRTLTGFLKNLKIYRTQRGTEKENKYLVIG